MLAKCPRTCSLDPALSRNALGSGATGWPSRPCSELSELFTLPLGVDVFVCGWGPGRALSFSRGGPLSDAGCAPGAPGPCDDVISRVAGGSALPCGCLLFLPNRNDMAPALQPWGRYNGSRCRSRTHSGCAEAGCVGWGRLGLARRDVSGVDQGWGGRRACERCRAVLWVRAGGYAHVWRAEERANVVGQGCGNVRRRNFWRS